MQLEFTISKDLTSDEARLLHSALALLQMSAGEAAEELVRGIQRDLGLELTGAVDASLRSAIERRLDQIHYKVTGKVSSPDRSSTGGLRVVIVDRDLRNEVILAETATKPKGTYEARFSVRRFVERCKGSPDLQAKVYACETLLASSETIYNAPKTTTLDVVLPAGSTALPSEYESLLVAIASHYCGPLRDLEESETREDITYLANKIGWDARLIAMAAMADRLAHHAAVRHIPEPFFYAVFRAGAPLDAASVYQISAADVEPLWKTAIESGIIPVALTEHLESAAAAWAKLVAAHATSAPLPGGGGNVSQLAALSLGNDEEKLQQFTSIFSKYNGDWPAFWDAVSSTFGAAITGRLQLDSALSNLTLGNIALITKLHAAEEEVGSVADLAGRGYYHAGKWAALIGKMELPPSLPPGTDAVKRAAYANLLAAQLRLQYPTAVAAAQVLAKTLPLSPGAKTTAETVSAFLVDQPAFRIDQQPIEQFLVRTKAQAPAGVVDEIKRIQRVYQLTQHDQAMSTLLAKNVDSAYKIAQYDREAFVRLFSEELGGNSVAHQIWKRARQVHGAVLHIATHYLTARLAPPIGVHSPAQILDPSPQGPSGDVVAQPTLETLFGSLDYCQCQECRSLLSPAAYLVDLLHFIDVMPKKSNNPQDVLFARRPDIQHLKLSCENTNTVLPYVDVVNETLEYFVSHAKVNSPPSLANYTGHDTDASIPSAELLASPQFVDDTAYTSLRGAVFPPPLPFHKALETMRRYFSKLGTPLASAMETLRANEQLDRASDSDYAWRDILMERLGLSREQYQLLTDGTITVKRLYGYTDDDTDATVPSDLAGVETFSRRTGVSYVDLVAILETRFINPGSVFLPQLQQLGVPFTALRDLHSGAMTSAAFGALLPPGLDPADFGGTTQPAPDGSDYAQVMGDTIAAWLASGTTYDQIMGLIVITNPADDNRLCDAAALQLVYANPDTTAKALAVIDYVKLLRFIRLWRQLGWSVEVVDSAISALSPPPPAGGGTPLALLDAAWAALICRLGVLDGLIDRFALDGARELESLFACWAPIETHGANALYRTMFLNASVLASDPAFAADAFGNVLQNTSELVKNHVATLRAAFGLTDVEFAAITAEVVANLNAATPPPTTAWTPATLPLTLDNVSAIYRHGWLARRLSISVVELLELVHQTGHAPFAPPDPPSPPIVKFLDFVDRLRRASLQPTQALYLVWDRDLSGKSAPDAARIHQLARALRSDFAAIESTFAIASDPTGDVARSLMTLVYGADTDLFFGLLNNTFIVSTPFASPPSSSPQPLITAEPRIAYDDFAKRLTFAGYLDSATASLLASTASGDATLTAAVTALQTAADAAVAPYFAKYPSWQGLLDAYAANTTDSPEVKRTKLLASILPELKRLRKGEQALADVSAAANVDLAFTTALLDDADVLNAAASTTLRALDDFTAFDTAESAPITGAFDGYLDPPANGLYDFAIDAAPTITGVTLVVGGTDLMMTGGPGTWTNSAPIQLAAGALTTISLSVTGTGALTIRWIAQGQSWNPITPDRIYSASSISHATTTFTRLLKVNALAKSLSLTSDEIAYFAQRPDLQISFTTSPGPWLDALPVGTSPAAFATDLRDRLITLLDFAWLKVQLSPDDERILGTFRGTYSVPAVTGWDTDSLAALLGRFGATDLSAVDTFRRVYDAFLLIKEFGISAPALLPAATNNPDPVSAPASTVVRDFESALRARYDADAWLKVIQPINDALRTLSRDALVAYVLQSFSRQPNNTIDTADKLYEYFLMDVQMDACMHTSRIRHALSSVQLFIERCFMNLEPKVPEHVFSASKLAQWEWMRRYRVWEANREVFLWPENWLEPELRDDQSSIFKETMNELLQSDITEDTAEVAMLNYLAKLEEIAKLEPCGTYYVDANNAHVVARTAGAHRKYYYRQLQNGSWTAWEQIPLDIEDNPIIPYVWKDRVLLFWLKVIHRGPETTQLPNTNSAPKDWTATDLNKTPGVNVGAVLCWSERYNGKWQATKTGDVLRPAWLRTVGFLNRNPVIVQFPPTGPASFDRSQLRIGIAENTQSGRDELRILVTDTPESKTQPHVVRKPVGPGGIVLDNLILAYPVWTSFLFLNTHSLPEIEDDNPSDLALDISNGRAFDSSTDTLKVSFEMFPSGAPPAGTPPSTEDVIKSLAPTTTRTVEALQARGDWTNPFFYFDARHVFYVQPSTAQIEPPPPGGPIIYDRIGNIIRRMAIDPVRYRGPGDPGPATNIHHVLSTAGTVKLGKIEIGASGAVRSVS